MRHHHEAFDGSGYPDGRKGEEIPLGAARSCAWSTATTSLTAGRPRAAGARPRGGAGRDVRAGGPGVRPAADLPSFMALRRSRCRRPARTSCQEGRRLRQAGLRRNPAEVQRRQDRAAGHAPGGLRAAQRSSSARTPRSRTCPTMSRKGPGDLAAADLGRQEPGLQGLRRGPAACRRPSPRLGFKETLSIVVAISNKSLYEAKHPQHRVLLDKMWVHSLATRLRVQADRPEPAPGRPREPLPHGADPRRGQGDPAAGLCGRSRRTKP
ncbi:MAG: hypothetical protein MZV70_71675 [Desulfobacterales bacterium]|nr:hypothetical protein [Desulfobacterales bacterium]